jgi:hypothetical protein
MATTFYIKVNDAVVTMTATLKNADGTVVNLTNAQSVHFHCGRAGDTPSKIVDAACTISTPKTAGIVTYSWTATDTNHDAGEYDGEFQVDFGAGQIITFPSKGNVKIVLGGEVA